MNGVAGDDGSERPFSWELLLNGKRLGSVRSDGWRDFLRQTRAIEASDPMKAFARQTRWWG